MSQFNPKVSIIIPVYMGPDYQHPDYLREAIDSALAQTYRNIEVIVVNDGSNDGGKTEEIAKSYGNKIRYFYKENGGVATALNFGIREMTGDYFSWLSHDDAYYPEKIEKQVRYLEDKTDKNIITYCAEEMIDENSQTIQILRIDKRYLKNIYLTILSTSIGGCSLLIPKVCFERVGLFNEKLRTTQDNEMWLRIARGGFQFDYLPEVLSKSRIHPEQQSNRVSKYHKEERENYFLWAVNFLDEETSEIRRELYELLKIGKYGPARKALSKIGREAGAAGMVARFYGLLAPIKKLFFSSSRYWEKRYSLGGNSGVGSYGILAEYKSQIINSFIKKNNIRTVIELGCGDGNQLLQYEIPQYIGIDVSKTAIALCRKKFGNDIKKSFFIYDDWVSLKNKRLETADLALSVDVIYHLVEETIFKRYIADLFSSSEKYVIIYSTNFDKSYNSLHQIDRKFTDYINNNISYFKLIDVIENPYKGEDTQSDFYIYKKL